MTTLTLQKVDLIAAINLALEAIYILYMYMYINYIINFVFFFTKSQLTE